MSNFAHRERLHAAQQDLAERFWNDEPIESLLTSLSSTMDNIITDLYGEHIGAQQADIALYAVGGYGRAELHPGSDIDLLIVAKKPDKLRTSIEPFLQAVFDLNLEVGHAVRDIAACKSESKRDLTVATAMFERRLLVGDPEVVKRLDKAMQATRLWPAAKFFQAKYAEQNARHEQFQNVDYDLEPNIKNSPGGLRDIHTVLWICQRQYGTSDPDQLENLNVLTAQEARWLLEGRRFIWWVRFGLHLVAGRKEDQLQFAHQRELAQRLGFADTDAQRGVERFMYHYYRHILALTEVNDVLIQHFQETVVAPRRVSSKQLNEKFNIVNKYIEAADTDIFSREPSTLLEIFVIMANRQDIQGVRLETIRAIRDNVELIDAEYRQNPVHTELFMQLLKAPYTLVSQLTRMRRYGILGRYIPEFGRIVGQMQHDLFHVYTVDAHTLMVVRNMRLFRYEASREEFPIAHKCVHSIPKVELLYLAGLFHDIGKGRGGDHSMLGSVDARNFCELHQLSEADTDLVCWLVEQHLYMSAVCQRQDIYDPEVVQAFAERVKSERHLDYLYALTVADIRATNPTLWNSWRATLLSHLYHETKRTLRLGMESTADRAATVAAYQEGALTLLENQSRGPSAAAASQLWRHWGEDFFLRHTPEQIVQVTTELSRKSRGPNICVLNTYTEYASEGATRIYVYTDDTPQLFAKTVVSLSNLDLTVVDATVHTSAESRCFDTYTVLNQSGESLPPDSDLRNKVITTLQEALQPGAPLREPKRRRLPRQVRDLAQPAEVSIEPGEFGDSSVLTVIADDRPGLLALLGAIFVELELKLLSAKIATLGERVEDTFVIQDAHDKAITDPETAYTLQQTIRQRIDAALRQT